jgi:hypothetical protein
MHRWRAPSDRTGFYSEVWGIDPRLAMEDDPDAVLYNTGYASLSYAGDYPLLGPSQQRALYTVDVGTSAGDILRLMRRHGVRFAYVPATAEAMPQVTATYPPVHFDLVHQSTIESGPLAGTFRSLFQLRSGPAQEPPTPRPDSLTP